jgi:hypothetical protein
MIDGMGGPFFSLDWHERLRDMSKRVPQSLSEFFAAPAADYLLATFRTLENHAIAALETVRFYREHWAAAPQSFKTAENEHQVDERLILRVSPDVIDQNHALLGSKVRRHYLHYDYADEKREAWRSLGERLDVILSGGNVVPLQRPVKSDAFVETSTRSVG